jgi:hypothetical protein
VNILDKELKEKDPKEQELIKKIAYHEAYSLAYKVRLAQKLLFRGAKIVGTAASKGGKMVKKKLAERKENPKA